MNWLTAGRIRLIAVLVVIGVAVVSTWLVFWSPVFAAKHIEVTGAEQVTAEEVRAAADVPLGAAMAQLPLSSIAERVERLDAVASARIERQWPNTVRIMVTERRPVAVTETAQGFGLVGSDGKVYTVLASAPEDLPVLVDVTGDLTGEVSGQSTTDSESANTTEAVAAFTVARSLPRQLRKHVATIDAVSPTSIRLTLGDGATVDWGTPEASIRKADVLLVLLRRHASPSKPAGGSGLSEQSEQSGDTGVVSEAQHYDVSVPDAPAWSN
jgi:cell division protein FtsQ